jgi:flagellar motor protein MotB
VRSVNNQDGGDRAGSTRGLLNTILDVPTDISLSWKSPEDSLLVGKNDPLYAIVSDYHFYNYAFCKEQRFTDQQSSAFLSIMKTIIDKDMNDSTADIDSSHTRFMHLLMKECVDRSPHRSVSRIALPQPDFIMTSLWCSMQVFDKGQGEEIIKYVIESYYRHFNLYNFNFTRKVTTVFQQMDSNGVELIKLPRALAVFEEEPAVPAADDGDEQPVGMGGSVGGSMGGTMTENGESCDVDSDAEDEEWARVGAADTKKAQASEAAGSSMEAIRAKRAGKIKGQIHEWQWKWTCAKQISWVSFLPEVGSKLEKAYKAGAEEQEVSLGGGTFRTCNFKRMVCINIAAKRAVDIRRTESEDGKRRDMMRIAKRCCYEDVTPIAWRAAADAQAAADRAYMAWRIVYRRRCMNSAALKFYLLLARVRKRLVVIQMANIQKRVLELMGDQAPRVVVDLIHGTVKMLENLGFVGGKAILLEESHPLMQEINFAMSCIKQTVDEFGVPFLDFQIEGHTSVAKKSKDGGKATSTDRAQAVMMEMVLGGIPEEHLTSFGFGDTKPISADKDKNRRVEIRVLPKRQKKDDNAGGGANFMRRQSTSGRFLEWWEQPTKGFPTVTHAIYI